MVRGALIAGVFWLLASTVSAQAVRLPSCRPEHIDVVLLSSLLDLELGGAAEMGQLEIGDSLCIDGAPIVFVLRDAAGHVLREGQVVLPTELDATSAARTLALALAERARAAPDDVVSSSAEESVTASEAVLAEAPNEVPDASLEMPPFGPLGPPPLRPTLGLGLRGRLAPVLPSWAIGWRGDITASIDSLWSIRGELLGTWSWGSVPDSATDAFVIAGGVALLVTPYRDPLWEFSVGAHGDLGTILIAENLEQTFALPWATLGVELDFVLSVTDLVALVLDVGVSGVVFGARVATTPFGPQIDLNPVLVDGGLSARLRL